MNGSVLLTGATGYIGGRLLRRFEEGGRAVRCLARDPGRLGARGPYTEIVQGDCLDERSLDRVFAGVRTAYYLVHSMAGGSDFAELDRRAAGNFGRAAARAGVERIGLTDQDQPLSTPVRRIGGAMGWYFVNQLWTVRSWLDRVLGGVGIVRGRRDPEECSTPGRGWLEFDVTPLDGGQRSRIRQTATFDPRGLLGQVYWYAISPLHNLIFQGMLDRIGQRALSGSVT